MNSLKKQAQDIPNKAGYWLWYDNEADGFTIIKVWDLPGPTHDDGRGVTIFSESCSDPNESETLDVFISEYVSPGDKFYPLNFRELLK